MSDYDVTNLATYIKIYCLKKGVILISNVENE